MLFTTHLLRGLFQQKYIFQFMSFNHKSHNENKSESNLLHILPNNRRYCMFAKKGTNEGEKAAQIGSTVHIASSIDLQLKFLQHDIMTVVRKRLSCRAGHFDAHSPM